MTREESRERERMILLGWIEVRVEKVKSLESMFYLNLETC
jgi:hypothetical protein